MDTLSKWIRDDNIININENEEDKLLTWYRNKAAELQERLIQIAKKTNKDHVTKGIRDIIKPVIKQQADEVVKLHYLKSAIKGVMACKTEALEKENSRNELVVLLNSEKTNKNNKL